MKKDQTDLSEAAHIYREKIEFLEAELAKTDDSEKKYSIKKRIEDAQKELNRLLGGKASSPAKEKNSPASSGSGNIVIGGSVRGSAVITGSGNTVIMGSDRPTSEKSNREVKLDSSGIDRIELLDKLNGLPVQQFNKLHFQLKPPNGIVPPQAAPQGDRVFALLSWAEGTGGCGLAAVEEALESIINPR